ncbi:alcohol acetyltransferase [Propionibacteriaceae bacterium Y2011]
MPNTYAGHHAPPGVPRASPVTRHAWVKLDNASNIFLAARSASDPKVFRLAAELDHEVDPDVLQDALDLTHERYPLYRAVLRAGVFWYYLQDSDLRPEATEEDLPTCWAIYRPNRRNLLFRVSHHRRRINLEVFHALSDGTGALWFLSDLVDAYVRLQHPELYEPPQPAPTAVDHGVDTTHTAHTDDGDQAGTPARGLIGDSFAHYFRRRPASGTETEFGEAAAVELESDLPPAPPPRWQVGRLLRPAVGVHRVRGTRTPDNRTRALELTMPAKDVLALARAEQVSMTIYLTGLFFEAIRLSAGDLGTSRTLAASVPVNLRQFFPSTSARNFFAAVRVTHTYGAGANDDLASICRHLEAEFRRKVTPQALERMLRRRIQFEKSPALRVVPRPIKDLLLGMINSAYNRRLTVAVSNLGRATLPEAARAHTGRMVFHVSAARPQFCAISHAGQLTISFTSPFAETEHVKEFARMLTARGVAVTVGAARATEDELAAVTS